ncbi:MAG: hypothetical protein QM690_18410 [Sphingobium sp.]
MTFARKYADFTNLLVKLADGQDKLVHMSAGLLIWLAVALLFRLPLRSIWPVVAVILLEGVNEVLDRLAYNSWRFHDTIRDVIATIFWPCVIMIALKLRPSLRR